MAHNRSRSAEAALQSCAIQLSHMLCHGMLGCTEPVDCHPCGPPLCASSATLPQLDTSRATRLWRSLRRAEACVDATRACDERARAAELEAGRASEAVQGLKAGLGLSSGESVPLAKASELDKLQVRCLPPIRP